MEGSTGIDHTSLSRQSNLLNTVVGFTNDDVEPVSQELKGKEAVIIRDLSKTYSTGRGKDPVYAVKGSLTS